MVVSGGMMAGKRHIPTTNEVHDIRTAFGKLWDAIDSSRPQAPTAQQRAAASAGSAGSSPSTSSSPSPQIHNSLLFLQGGSPYEFFHLTNAEYVGTGSGVFTRNDSPALTGNPTAPTPAVDDNDTSIATTAWHVSQGATTAPIVDGIATAGTSSRWAHGDHVHPTDTSRAPILSPVFTGDPQAPTPALSDNDTSIATTAWTKGQNYQPLPPSSVSKSPTGFSDPELITSTYDSVARTITITGTFSAYYYGELVAALVPGWVSAPHPATDGPWFLLYDGANYVWQSTLWTFDNLMIAYVYYGTTDKFSVREVHGLMDWHSHEEFHRTIGTYLETGGDLSSYTLASTTPAFRRPAVSSASVHDEDLHTTIPALAAGGPYTRLSLTSTGTTTFTTGSLDIVALTGNNPYYNAFATPNWIQTPMANNSYMTVWLVAVPATDDTGSQAYRYLWLQGQTNGSKASQQSYQFSSMNLGQIASLFTEFVAIGKIILRYQGGNWNITSVEKITGTRLSNVTAPAGNYLSSVSVTAPLTGTGTISDPVVIGDLWGNITGASAQAAPAGGWTGNHGAMTMGTLSATAGTFSLSSSLTGAANSVLSWSIINSDPGASASASFLVKNDVLSQIALLAYGSGRTATIFGKTIGNWVAVMASQTSTVNGMLFGIQNQDKPIVIGINNIQVAEFTGGTLATQSFKVLYTTASTSTTTGALVVSGGVGVAGSVTIGGNESLVTANGASWIHGSVSELLTLSVAGTTTDTTANLLPANAIIESVVARVTTAITTATSWALGDATTPARFAAANTTMTLGSTSVGTVHADKTGAAGPRQVAAAKVRVTTVGTPGAGAIRITVFYRQFVAPTS